MKPIVLSITGIVAVAALVLLYLMWKMILTGDYSMLLNQVRDSGGGGRQPQRNVRQRIAQPVSTFRETIASTLRPVKGLDLAVEHFVQELPEWSSPAERKSGADEIDEMIERRRQST